MMRKCSVFIVMGLGILLLSGCSYFGLNAPVPISSPAKQYLEESAQAVGDDSQRYQVLAANQMLEDDNINDADQLLRALGKLPLEAHVASERAIVQARLALLIDKPARALQYLNAVRDLKQLSYNAQILYYTVSVQAHLRMHNVPYSMLARMSLGQLLEDDVAVAQNRQRIWYDLQSLSLQDTQMLMNRSNTEVLRGWLALGVAAKTYANQPKALVSALENWRNAYATHPANWFLPSSDQLQTIVQGALPKHIALLLPMHGPFGKMGQAVRDGFITAFYAESKSGEQPNIQVLDTSQNVAVEDLYAQALAQGAQFVVGPLTKQNVAQLADRASIEVPTVVLNYLPDGQNAPDNMVEFGLDPGQSAEQAADYAWQMGVNNILMITPQSERAEKVKQAFVEHWQSLGGSIVGILTFSTQDKLASDIRVLLNVDQSDQRAQDLQDTLGEKFKAVPRRRQDINGIFMLATPAQAQQINPLLRFYYAGDLPIFSVSDIYNGYANSRRDIDLNGIYFLDMPLLLDKNGDAASLRRQITETWKNNYRVHNRLYGLGIDAYRLSKLWTRLWVLPNFAIEGVTGRLFLQSDHRIYRQLVQARFTKGLALSS